VADGSLVAETALGAISSSAVGAVAEGTQPGTSTATKGNRPATGIDLAALLVAQRERATDHEWAVAIRDDLRSLVAHATSLPCPVARYSDVFGGVRQV
jgi:hypothetical protein